MNRTVTATPRGWAAWTVTAVVGDDIEVQASCGSGYGWVAIMDKGYARLSAQVRYERGRDVVLRHRVTKAGTYRVGTGRVGPVTMKVTVTPAATVLPSWSAPGPFGEASFWRADVRDLPVSPDSPALVADLVQQVADFYGGVAALNVAQYNVACYEVSASVPRVDVAFRDEQRKGYVPRQIGDHFRGVPWTAQMLPAKGTDGALAIWCPQTDQLWEFWRARSDGPSAVWGGRIDNVSTSPGWFTDGMGASATGVATSRGCISVADVAAGRIDHALSLAIPRQARGHVWPAQRDDGNGLGLIPEGTTLRMDPDIDTTRLHPIARLAVEAAQVYGLVVTDNAGCVALATEVGVRLDAPSYLVLRGFPWHHLRVVAAPE